MRHRRNSVSPDRREAPHMYDGMSSSAAVTPPACWQERCVQTHRRRAACGARLLNMLGLKRAIVDAESFDKPAVFKIRHIDGFVTLAEGQI